MEKIRKNAAGIDIGAKQLFVALENKPVRVFDTFTEDMEALASYLISEKVSTVAMEATGVYWVILFDILENKGLDVWLVDGRQTRQLPGRKTDVKDCQWILQLHSYGLFNRCFVPDALVKETRAYQRLRQDHIQSKSMHINHMHKALTLMNIRLKEVLSQVHGVSGLKIIKAILAGERDPNVLVDLCHTSILKKKKEQVKKALKGNYHPSGLFALQQAYQAYYFYLDQIKACDQQIQEVLEKINQDRNLPSVDEKRKPIRHHKPEVDNLDGHLLAIFGGQDATKLPGLTDYSWFRIFTEVGSDMSKFKSAKHFTSWLGLAPGQNNSGKKKKKSKYKGKPAAGQIFREIAQSLMNSKNIALGAFGRRLRAKKGPAIAIKATARKLATLYWNYYTHGSEYVEKGVAYYEELVLQNKRKALDRLAEQLGVQVA